MNKKVMVAAMLAGLLLGVHANAGTAPAQWYNQVTIKYVYAGQAGGRVAIGINAVVDVGSCPPAYSELVLDQNNNPYAKSMLALIMTAYATERAIGIKDSHQIARKSKTM